jgi:hypothetical protein
MVNNFRGFDNRFGTHHAAESHGNQHLESLANGAESSGCSHGHYAGRRRKSFDNPGHANGESPLCLLG